MRLFYPILRNSLDYFGVIAGLVVGDIGQGKIIGTTLLRGALCLRLISGLNLRKQNNTKALSGKKRKGKNIDRASPMLTSQHA
jgi:hypothetical protein